MPSLLDSKVYEKLSLNCSNALFATELEFSEMLLVKHAQGSFFYFKKKIYHLCIESNI